MYYYIKNVSNCVFIGLVEIIFDESYYFAQYFLVIGLRSNFLFHSFYSPLFKITRQSPEMFLTWSQASIPSDQSFNMATKAFGELID